MTRYAVLLATLLVAISVSAQTSGPTTREQALEVARSLGTSEMDIFLTKGHIYAPLDQAVKNAQRMNPNMSPIVSVDSVSGTSGSYLISITTSSDQKHFKLSMTPKANDCSWSLFSDEHGIIYFGKPIDCFEETPGKGK